MHCFITIEYNFNKLQESWIERTIDKMLTPVLGYKEVKEAYC